MDRALSIAEIRFLICTLATDHTLAQLARCSKNFHEPAIRVLWSTIPDISPLVRCFPADSWTVIRIPRVGDSIKLVRSLAPQDWTTFLKYSNLVRRLGTSLKSSDRTEGRTYKLEERVLLELSAYRPVFVLFPNLIASEWPGIRLPEEDLPVVLGFLNPNISRIAIQIAEPHHNPDLLQTSISLIASRFQSLKDVHLTRRAPQCQLEDDLQLMPSIFSLVQSLPALEEFRCFYVPLTEDVFVALGSLQHLNLLAFRLPDMTDTVWTKVTTPSELFPKLKTLSISSRTQDYIKFSRTGLFLNAKNARIILDDVPTVIDLPRVVTSIYSQLSPSGLLCLTCVMLNANSHQVHRQFEQWGPIIRLDHLRPFFRFANLTYFKFSVASLYELDDAAYSAFAKAWPQIRTFEVGQGKYCTHLRLPAMRDVLVPFAVHCPKLIRLSVRFSGRIAEVSTDGGIENPIPQGTHSTSVVKTLDCFDSSIAEAPRVAAFLALIFPRLKEVVWKDSRDGILQPGESWEEVKRYLPLFISVREDGRRREADRQEQQRS